MKYNEFECTYHFVNRYCKATGVKQHEKPLEFYNRHLLDIAQNLKEFGDDGEIIFNQASFEQIWWKIGSPYYRFHPAAAKLFANTRLDVPVKYLKFPSRVFVINFSENDPSMKLDDKHYVKSVLVYRGLSTNIQKNTSTEAFTIYLDIGEIYSAEINGVTVTLPLLTFRQLFWTLETEDQTLEEIMCKLPVHPSALQGVIISEEMLIKCYRLIVSMAFLKQDENPIIIPHVLSKDSDEWHRADKTRKEQLEEKAIRVRESEGWLVGHDEMFEMGKIGKAMPGQPSECTGREHMFARFVTGHWKLVRYGPQREFGRVRWIMPYISGEGKPFKHDD